MRVTTGGAAAPFADDWTCGIKLGDGHWPGLVAERLFGADLIPVCAPRLARRLKKPGDLDSGAAVTCRARPRRLAAVAEGGGRQYVSAKGPMFEYYGQALQAASDGLGVALGIRPTSTTTSRRAG